MSPDGRRLVYAIRETDIDSEPSGGRDVIYVTNFNLPVDVEHEIVVAYEHAGIPVPRPVWGPDSEGLYYMRPDGMVKYCLAKERPETVLPASLVKGLFRRDEENPVINPHAVHVDDQTLNLAYKMLKLADYTSYRSGMKRA